MTFSGKMDAGGKSKTQLPFVLEKKRPRKTRVELAFKNDTAVQVYDGVNGWKLRPYLGRKTVEPYSAEELKAAGVRIRARRSAGGLLPPKATRLSSRVSKRSRTTMPTSSKSP